ncbi:Alpha/Beta hydrolase protein [Mycena leptocephala]|nr:Alpha/Beta hydrolase protein [Mycena leptocephala]
MHRCPQIPGISVLQKAKLSDVYFNVQPFKIDLSSKIPRLNALVNNTLLPTKPLYPDVGPDKGIELDFLSELRSEWLGSSSFDWDTQQAELNQFDHYTVEIEGQIVHFIARKVKGPRCDSCSFQEFAPVIKPLTQLWISPTGKKVSYNVVVPSLPGFLFSSAPPNANWTVVDTARVFNTLMTEVLGYPTYALHGTDWGSAVGYSLYSGFNTTVRAAHFVFLPFLPPTPEQIAEDNITLSAIQKVTEQKTVDWTTTQFGYFIEQVNKVFAQPNDIGLALYDSPVGQLAWVAGNIKLWSDPRAGTPPSVLNNAAILTSNPGLSPVYTKAPTDAPMLFSQYEYNIGLWPQEYAAKVGNLVSYTVHDFGGHFPGLDNPPALIGDIREMALYYMINA